MVWLSGRMLAQQDQDLGPTLHTPYSTITAKRHRSPELQRGWGTTLALNTKPIYLCDRRAVQLALLPVSSSNRSSSDCEAGELGLILA